MLTIASAVRACLTPLRRRNILAMLRHLFAPLANPSLAICLLASLLITSLSLPYVSLGFLSAPQAGYSADRRPTPHTGHHPIYHPGHHRTRQPIPSPTPPANPRPSSGLEANVANLASLKGVNYYPALNGWYYMWTHW